MREQRNEIEGSEPKTLMRRQLNQKTWQVYREHMGTNNKKDTGETRNKREKGRGKESSAQHFSVLNKIRLVTVSPKEQDLQAVTTTLLRAGIGRCGYSMIRGRKPVRNEVLRSLHAVATPGAN